MIKAKTKTHNQINSIIKDYIDNNKFSFDYELRAIKKELIYSYEKRKSLLLIVLLDDNRLKLINQDIHLAASNYVNIIILGKYLYSDFVTDYCYRDCFPNDNNELKEFIKSDIFKNRILEIFSEYNIKKLNGEFNNLNSLFNFKISMNEATIKQKIYCYLETISENIKNTIVSSIDSEISSKSELEKYELRKKILNFFYKNSLQTSYNYENYNNYHSLNKILMSLFFEKTNNELDIFLDTLVNYIENLYNEKIGELNKNFINKKLDYYDFDFTSYSKKHFKYIIDDKKIQHWTRSSKFKDEDKRKLLRLIGAPNLLKLLGYSYFSYLLTKDIKNIFSLINLLNNDYVYNLKFNNNILLKGSEVYKFYTNSLFEVVSSDDVTIYNSIDLLKVPKYVKELYIPKDEYIKFKKYCSLFKIDENSVIPKMTKIIFVEDISDENFADKLV